MRVTQSEIYRTFLSDLESLNTRLNTLSRQVSSGKKLAQLKDSPAGCAELVSLTELQSNIDQYRSNIATGSYFLTVADSALNEVNNLVTSVYTKASEASSETLNQDARATIASEIRSLRDQILSLANSQVRGRYIFAGSAVSSPPFVLNGNSVSYQGNGEVNSIVISDGLEVRQGVAGSDAFNSIFSAIDGLLSGLDGNDLEAIKTSMDQFSAAFSSLGQARGQVGANLSLLQGVKISLQSQEITLKQQRGLVEDADMAEAVVRLKEVQTALQTAVTAGGSILQQSNLFDILG